ncbi:type I methionyl aminopeptidase [Gorillibacterium massiliense]|uniref:type I methionyl aminopeptidase n=1 Tax=Gorillibacterium massiliense TaxID=1280390 RepID=UPI0004BBD4D1|nr:type I methionyl aminopeptidase [Gorillibacterium massiliense]
MIIIKKPEEIAKMREAGKLLAACHKEIAKRIVPGVTTWELDEFADAFVRAHGATHEQKGYHGYPYSICASVNDVVCHGFPKKIPLQEGDIVTIDMVVNLNGWLADSAWSYGVGKLSPEVANLLKTTEESMYKGIAQAVVGNRMGDISHAIQSYAEGKGYSVVRQFIGHGIGQEMHEDPEVPHYGPAGRGLRLKEGMVITVEPMINTGHWEAYVEEDGWTARTRDGGLSAQYEHTIAITKDGPLILTLQD